MQEKRSNPIVAIILAILFLVAGGYVFYYMFSNEFSLSILLIGVVLLVSAIFQFTRFKNSSQSSGSNQSLADDDF